MSQALSIVWFTMNNATLAIACTATLAVTFCIVGGYVGLYLTRTNMTLQRRLYERMAKQ